jgi:hypothetical protein
MRNSRPWGGPAGLRASYHRLRNDPLASPARTVHWWGFHDRNPARQHRRQVPLARHTWSCRHWDGYGRQADLSFPIGQIGQRNCPASSGAALMEAVRLPTRQVPKIAKGSSGNRSFFRASGARFTSMAARINANPRGDIMEGRFRVGWPRPWPFRKAFNYSSQLEKLL